MKAVVGAKADPMSLLKNPIGVIQAIFTASNGLPIRVPQCLAPVMQARCEISVLPSIVSWPMDGGPFVTLPQVYSEHPNYPGNPLKSNLGMYRVQLSGNEYLQDKEVGIHYQIHRGIGVHQKRHQ